MSAGARIKRWVRRIGLTMGLVVLLLAGLAAIWRLLPGALLPQLDKDTAYLDMHVHVAGLGAGGSGCFVSPTMRDNFRFPFFLSAMGVTEDELMANGDAIMIQRLEARIRDSRRVSDAVILALDGVVDANGQLDREATHVFVPNDYVAVQAAASDILHFGASINPLRFDALERLDQAHRQGAVLVKWIPSLMHFDPADPRVEPFYDRLVEYDLPLLTHAGQERSFPGVDDSYGDPRKLAAPLERGVTVIAAHIATTGSYDGRRAYDLLAEMFARYPNLYADVSSLTQVNKIGYLSEAMARADFEPRLVYGSDWPLHFFPLVHPLYQWPELTMREARTIADIDNEWDRNVAIKQLMGVSESTFHRSRELLLD